MAQRFPALNPTFPVLLHGGDYNPDQWQKFPEVLSEDLRLMTLAGANALSVGIFAWAALEPEEGRFTFDWLDRTMDSLERNGQKVILATPSGAKPNWMAAKYPEITFETKSLANVKTNGDVTTADVTGTFSLHGVSNEITVPVKFTYLKDKLSARVPNLKGDLLVIRANFAINREDFNINKGQYEDKVSPTINLSLAIAGSSVTK